MKEYVNQVITNLTIAQSLSEKICGHIEEKCFKYGTATVLDRIFYERLMDVRELLERCVKHLSDNRTSEDTKVEYAKEQLNERILARYEKKGRHAKSANKKRSAKG